MTSHLTRAAPPPSLTHPAPLQPATLAWRDEHTPYSPAYDDIYHSNAGGIGQVHHVFLNGNQLPQRWQGRDRFTILESGFGLGLSFLVTWQTWRADPQRSARLHFISTELHPFALADLITLHQAWPELTTLAAELHANYPPLTPGFHQLLLDDGCVTLTLLLGDALHTLPHLIGTADAIYLDGFAPEKNPQLWSAETLAAISEHAADDATLATWCTAGSVRTTLKAQGWTLKKQAGFGNKWHMLSGKLKKQRSDVPPLATATQSRNAIVIGAGIAGCSMVEALARRGWQVTLIEQHNGPAQEASGNPAGLLHPMLARDDNAAARFSRAGYLYALRLIDRLQNVGQQRSGLLELSRSSSDVLAFSPDYVRWVDQPEASRLAGMATSAGGWWFPQGRSLNPASLCAALLAKAQARLSTHYGRSAERISHTGEQWQVFDEHGQLIAAASRLILANASAATRLLPDIELSLRRIRGQISVLPASAVAGLKTAVCGNGYVTAPHQGSACLGASFVEDDTDASQRLSEHAENLQKLAELLPGTAGTLQAETLTGRVAFRTASHDRLPLVGPLPQAAFRVTCTLNSLPRLPGLYALLGLGSRGLIWAPLAAELLAAQINHEALPLDKAVCKALDPARFHLRHLRQRPDSATPVNQGHSKS